MANHGALDLRATPGDPPTLAEPIPDLSLVALDVMLSARLREFLLLTDGDRVHLAGHRFTVVGWVDRAMVWRHDGPESD